MDGRIVNSLPKKNDISYPEDNINRGKNHCSSNFEKGVKPALLIDTINETKSREETDASYHTANLASDNPSGGEHLMNLTVILREICNFRQDVKEQLEDTKGEIAKTDTRLDEVGAPKYAQADPAETNQPRVMLKKRKCENIWCPGGS